MARRAAKVMVAPRVRGLEAVWKVRRRRCVPEGAVRAMRPWGLVWVVMGLLDSSHACQ